MLRRLTSKAVEARHRMAPNEGAAALRAQARRLLEHLVSSADLDMDNVGYSLAARPLLEDRAVLLGGDHKGLLDALRALARGETAANVVCSTRERDAAEVGGPVAFLFTGQGSQRV